MVKIALAQYPITFHRSLHDWENHVEKWVGEAAEAKSQMILFPEYGAMELTSLLAESERRDLPTQSKNLKKNLESFVKIYANLAAKYNLWIIAPSFPLLLENGKTVNRTYVFSPSCQKNGPDGFQDKIYMTRFEDEDWNVQSGATELKVFKTPWFDFSIAICFDVEFAEPAIKAAHQGAKVLFAPSCTETLRGLHRVHVGARARALENQMYVAVAQTVGNAEWSPAVDINNGQAGIYGPPDLGFPEDGIVALGELNKPSWLYAEIDLALVDQVRSQGAVFNYKKHMK